MRRKFKLTGKAQRRKFRNILQFRTAVETRRGPDNPHWGVPFRRWAKVAIEVGTGKFARNGKEKMKSVEVWRRPNPMKPVRAFSY